MFCLFSHIWLFFIRDPLFPAGDPRGGREAQILEVRCDNDPKFPLVLSTGHLLSKDTYVQKGATMVPISSYTCIPSAMVYFSPPTFTKEGTHQVFRCLHAGAASFSTCFALQLQHMQQQINQIVSGATSSSSSSSGGSSSAAPIRKRPSLEPLDVHYLDGDDDVLSSSATTIAASSSVSSSSAAPIRKRPRFQPLS